ncbi:MAG: DUF3488 and transglutaminase-like domain-containing protein [Desulfobacteraceae bacterium]|nr:DUF3488 and transglutaminase-like domain-containing protein [Desulfobacteraceae bacterium]
MNASLTDPFAKLLWGGRPGSRLLRQVILALVVAIAPHAGRLPIWVVAWCLLLWIWADWVERRGRAGPQPGTRIALTVAGLFGGLFLYGFSFDLDVGVGLLTIMLGLKPLEIRTHRDRMITLFLAYFLVITNLLYNNDLFMALYMFASVLVTSAVLIQINNPDGPFLSHLRLSGRILLQALPLAAILFLVFPRLPSGLWGSPKASTGTTGLSDEIRPGSVSRLVQNQEIAFRVEFDGSIPPADRLYWRGIVFQDFDGKRWYRASRAPRRGTDPTGAQTVSYSIILEPHGQRWVFGLDIPFSDPIGSIPLADHTLIRWRKVNATYQYRLKSYLQYRTGPLQGWERLRTRRLPPQGNPKSRALAEQWARDFSSPQEIIDAALAFLAGNRFVYSLQVPETKEEPIDALLFDTRRGYCEHYASAFAFLMRAAGIPSRVVGGYLGGERNPYGDYLIVRQSDAHAWVEVWLEERGWTRVDPTSVVMPARIEQGTAAALTPEEREALFSNPYLGPLSKYWKPLLFGLDLINNRWQKWVLGYDYFRQRMLYNTFGLDASRWKAVAWAVLAVAGLAALYGLFFFLRIRKRKSVHEDPVQRLYRQFCRRLSDVGIERSPHQGPVAFAKIVTSTRPDLSETVRRVTQDYVAVRYASKDPEYHLRRLKKTVRRFRPPKTPVHGSP